MAFSTIKYVGRQIFILMEVSGKSVNIDHKKIIWNAEKKSLKEAEINFIIKIFKKYFKNIIELKNILMFNTIIKI